MLGRVSKAIVTLQVTQRTVTMVTPCHNQSQPKKGQTAMSRTAKDTNELIAEELQTVIDEMQNGHLSRSEILEISYQWCNKNYEYHVKIANDLSIKPGALILFALLYINHPLLVADGRGLKYGFLRCKAEIIRAQLEERTVEIPILNSIHSIHSLNELKFHPQPVDSVDRMPSAREEAE
jgi:hypothetical protein